MARSQTPYPVFPQVSIIDFLKRNARLIAAVGLFVTFWMLVYTFTVYKPNFAAKATVIIKDSAITSRYIEPEQYYALQTTSSSSSNPVLNTMGILKSGAISDALWQYFQTKRPEQLKKNKIKTKKEWDSFYQDGSAFIKAKNQPGTDLISIQFGWSDPVIAKEALSVVVKAFQEASRDLNKEEQISRTKFLNKQVVEIEKELAAIRKQKSDYQSTKRTISVKREGDDLAGSRMELSNKLSQLESQARGKENMVRRYQSLLGMSPEVALKASAIGQNSSMTRLQDELYRLQQQYSHLNTSLTETNPKVREVQAQIDQVKASIEAEQVRTMGKLLPESKNGIVADNTRNTLITHMLQAQGEAQDLRAQAAVTRERLGQINRDIRTFPETAEGLANIEQKEASLSTALDQLREKVLEGKLKEEQTLSNVFIVDAPRLPEKAQFPTRTHLIVLSILMGLGVGITSAFAKEQFLTGVPVNLPNWLEPIDGNDANDDHTGNGNGNGRNHDHDSEKEPALLPQTPQALPPSSPVHALLPTAPVPEKVELPAVGSLFDSLMPVAGPMKHTPTLSHQPEFRHDLTQPLYPMPARPQHQAAPPVSQEPIQPAPSAVLAVPTVQPATASPLADAHLLPPEPEIVPRAKSVKVAAPPADPALLQRHSRPHQPKSLNAGLIGVPVLHAAPSPQPVTQEAAQQPPTENTLDASAQAVYEAQAKSMPLPPRRRRSIPSFLLDGQDNPGNADFEAAEPAPYTLVPKKQLLTPDDNLMEDVAPLEAPIPEPQPEAAEFEAASPIPAFMRQNAPKAKPQRKPLLSGLLFGKKPSRNPQIYFGIGARSQKQMELPGSLNRLMHSLDRNPATVDS